MNENEQYVADSIETWVSSGFYTRDDIEDMIEDIIEDDCDVEMLQSLVGPALRSKLKEERSWPQVTDCDRLDTVFAALEKAGICALSNAGYTMSDGESDVAEAVADAGDGRYTGYCFYHGQDVERAVNGEGVMIAFGALTDDRNRQIQVGQSVADALRAAGFAVNWDGSIDTRIHVPVFDWKRRAVKD